MPCCLFSDPFKQSLTLVCSSLSWPKWCEGCSYTPENKTMEGMTTTACRNHIADHEFPPIRRSSGWICVCVFVLYRKKKKKESPYKTESMACHPGQRTLKEDNWCNKQTSRKTEMKRKETETGGCIFATENSAVSIKAIRNESVSLFQVCRLFRTRGEKKGTENDGRNKGLATKVAEIKQQMLQGGQWFHSPDRHKLRACENPGTAGVSRLCHKAFLLTISSWGAGWWNENHAIGLRDWNCHKKQTLGVWIHICGGKQRNLLEENCRGKKYLISTNFDIDFNFVACPKSEGALMKKSSWISTSKGPSLRA